MEFFCIRHINIILMDCFVEGGAVAQRNQAHFSPDDMNQLIIFLHYISISFARAGAYMHLMAISRLMTFRDG